MRQQVDAIARRHGLLTSTDGKRLVAALRELSERYNDERPVQPDAVQPSLHGARLQFSLARDLPKSREALVELRHADLLPRRGPIALLDLGAGLGATTLGALAALAQAGFSGEVHVTLVEPDAKALELAGQLVPALAPAGIGVRVTARRETLESTRALDGPPYDLVLFGQVFSEEARTLEPEARIVRHTDLLERALRNAVKPGGSLLVVEPALRVRTRHLHHVRDRLLQRFAATASADYRPVVHSPCPHAGGCGALAVKTDWCHEDRRVDLPAWLVPIARGAGLRWQGLTFSYLVLRRDGRTLESSFGAGSRVVSDLRKVKGKSELTLCTEPARLGRLECLDRDAKGPRGEVWRALERGDLIRVSAAELARGRLDADSPLVPLHAVGERT